MSALSPSTSDRDRWHADVKPDNILRVKGKFKLADPGFATFELKEAFAQAEKRHAEAKKRQATTMIRGGTKTYGESYLLYKSVSNKH